MIQHQTLRVNIPEGELHEYISVLYDQAEMLNYIRLTEIEQKLAADKTLDLDYICLQTPRLHVDNQYLVATIWLSIEHNVLELKNITSNQRTFLSVEEYNAILIIFFRDVLKRAKMKGVRRHLSKPIFDLGDVMGVKCAGALKAFSDYANKGSELVHPTDFELWAKFVKLAHSTKARITAVQLETWLKEDGWEARCAEHLASYYEYSLELLEYV